MRTPSAGHAHMHHIDVGSVGNNNSGGAESAYYALADNFCTPETNFKDVPFVSPRLSLFMNDVYVKLNARPVASGKKSNYILRVDIVATHLLATIGRCLRRFCE